MDHDMGAWHGIAARIEAPLRMLEEDPPSPTGHRAAPATDEG
jgi:hypothetical protein